MAPPKSFFHTFRHNFNKIAMREQRFLGLIEQSIQKHWELPALSEYKGRTLRYKDLARQLARFHLWLERAGIGEGDKVAILGRNSINWVVAFFGTLSHGAVAVPLLHEFKPDSVHALVEHSEAKVLLVSKAIWENLDAAQMPGVRLFARLEDFALLAPTDESEIATWEDTDRLFRLKYPNFTPADVSFHLEMPDELAILNYTSGTTSFSKGVMIPYRSLWSNTQFAYDNLEFIHPGDDILCMLPMAHMYGLAFEVLNSINKGCHIHLLMRIPSPQYILNAFRDVRPHLILAVPLILEKIVKNKIFPMLEKPALRTLIRIPFIKRLILRKIRERMDEAFGEEFEEIIVGGAALNRDVENFLREIGFRYTIGYGMTECGPLVSYAYWGTFKPGSVGRIVDRMEVKIDSPDSEKVVGEILVRGMNTMLGYYKNEDATRATFTPDGWMRTGDLGLLDAERNLFIKGRCKTMILGANGQNIYPEEIEDGLNNLPYVAESLVVMRGDKLVALIVPDQDALKHEGIASNQLPTLMKANIDTLNASMPKYCKVSFFEIQEQAFEKTPKQSIKRYLYK